MKYYLLSINFTNYINEDKVTKRLDKGFDWIQVFPGTFLIKSNSEPQIWYERLSTVLNKNLFLIIEVDISKRHGWLEKRVWDWMKSK